MSSPDVENDPAPKWASNSQRVFLMGRAMFALTGRAAKHKNTPKNWRQHSPTKKLSGSFVANRLEVVNPFFRALFEYCFACGSRKPFHLKEKTKPYSEPIQTVLKPHLETVETVLDLYSDKGMFPFPLRGAHKKISLKIDTFPFSNCTRNRTRTAADFWP